MYSITPLYLDQLSPELIHRYQALQNAERFDQGLSRIDFMQIDPKSFYGVKATADNQPIGLAWAYLLPASKFADIKSIAVDKIHRDEGIAASLLNRLTEDLTHRGFQLLMTTFSDRKPRLNEWEQLLYQQGWEGKKQVMVECRFDSSQFNPPWLRKPYSLKKDFEIFLWDSLKPEEEAAIRSAWQAGSIPELIYPFREKAHFEPLNSLGLRYQGKVVGWIVTTRTEPNTILYDLFYIRSDLQSSGMSILLLIESIKRHIEAKIPWGLIKINLLHSSYRWLLFIKKRLIPSANSIINYYQFWKILNPR